VVDVDKSEPPRSEGDCRGRVRGAVQRPFDHAWTLVMLARVEGAPRRKGIVEAF